MSVLGLFFNLGFFFGGEGGGERLLQLNSKLWEMHGGLSIKLCFWLELVDWGSSRTTRRYLLYHQIQPELILFV